MCAKPATSELLVAQMIPVEKLDLDLMNPRLTSLSGVRTQDTLLAMLWEEGALDELALSIYENGYFSEEPLIAIKDGARIVVVEGNRRLATVKLLRSEQLRNRLRATDLPKLSKSQLEALDELPVCIYPNRKTLWPYLGFRHVNGPMTWDSWSKAQYIAQVSRDFGLKLDDIAKSIGDKNQTVARLYRGMMVVNQATEQAGFDLEDRHKAHFSFSHLYTGLDYTGFQQHLGLGKDDGYKPNPIKKQYIGNLKELMVWLFGSTTENKPPIIRSQNPDLKTLDDVLSNKKALSALRSGLGLSVSHEISLGDDVRFREALTRIKYDLQQAKGLVLHGFNGEMDMLKTAHDIAELAANLADEMGKQKPRKGGR
jgi:hypothetical protein